MFFVRVFCQLYAQICALCFTKKPGCVPGCTVSLQRRRGGYVSFWFWLNATCRSLWQTVRCAGFRHVTPLPHPELATRKTADMFEGNVLGKKSRGGWREEYLKKRFALLRNLPVNICIYVKIEGFYLIFHYLFNLLFDDFNSSRTVFTLFLTT